MTKSRTPRPPDLDPDEVEFLNQHGEWLGLEVPGPACLPPAVLLAAEHRALPSDMQARADAHAAACARCQRLGRDLRDSRLEEPTADEVRRIDARLRVLTSAVAGVPRHGRVRPGLWPLATAASLMLATGLGIWGMNLQRQTQSLSQQAAGSQASPSGTPSPSAAALVPTAQVNVDIIDLEPRDALRAGANDPARFVVSTNNRVVTLILASVTTRGDGPYSLEIQQNGEVLWQASGLRRTALGTFALLVPRDRLPDGRLTLMMRESTSAQAPVVNEYDLVVASR